MRSKHKQSITMRMGFLGAWLGVYQPTTGGAQLGVFLASYVITVFVLALVILCVFGWARLSISSAGFMSLSPLRWVWLILLVAMAGFPPALFFFGKVGLLTIVWQRGGVSVLSVVVLLVLIAWRTYFGFVQGLLASSTSKVVLVARYQRGWYVVTLGLFLIGLVLGGLFAGEALVFCGYGLGWF